MKKSGELFDIYENIIEHNDHVMAVNPDDLDKKIVFKPTITMKDIENDKIEYPTRFTSYWIKKFSCGDKSVGHHLMEFTKGWGEKFVCYLSEFEIKRRHIWVIKKKYKHNYKKS